MPIIALTREGALFFFLIGYSTFTALRFQAICTNTAGAVLIYHQMLIYNISMFLKRREIISIS